MKSKAVLTLNDLKKIAAGAEAEASKNNWNVSIAICDDGGHLLFYLRMDGAAPVSSHIAPQKARTAAISRRNTKLYEEMVNGGRYSALSMPEVTHLEGGVPIIVDGNVIGAVGVSGVKSSEDAQIAEAGIQALLG